VVPAGTALEDGSAGSTSRPSSHCLSRSSSLASPRRRPSILDGCRVPRTLGAPSARLIAWCAIHGQTVSRAARKRSPGSSARIVGGQGEDLLDARSSVLRSADDRRHAPRITRPGVAARRLRRGASETPSSKHIKLCTTLGRRRVFSCPGARSIRTRAPQRSAGGRSHRSLPGQSSTPGSLLRRPRACSSGNLAAAFAAPSEGRQVEACASTLPSWLRRFNRTDRPAMNRARWV